MLSEDLVVQTCEARANGERGIPFSSPEVLRTAPFETNDPFGLRKAVLPIFERTIEGNLIGMGTAVHVDGWGGLLTAEHVIDFLRQHAPQRGLAGARVYDIDLTNQNQAIALLGIGLVFGQVGVPQWAFAPILETLAVSQEADDPLANLQGRRSFRIAFDVAGLHATIPAAAYGEKNSPKTLPVALERWEPAVGEEVLAFGYPELKPSAIVSDDMLQNVIQDGLFGAYGKITRLFRNGRDHANPTPVFEVSAHWPSGMSGGPVVNSAGNVVGIVSRSLAPDGESLGVGYAACLPWIPELRRLLPRLDSLNPGSRLGYGVFDQKTHRLLSTHPDYQTAMQWASKLNRERSIEVLSCSHRIGTDEYMLRV